MYLLQDQPWKVMLKWERNEYTSIDPVDWIVKRTNWSEIMRYVPAWSTRGSNIKTIKACVYLCRAYSLESYRCLRLQVSSWSGSGCYLMQVIALLSWIGLTKEWYSDILSRNEMCWCTDCCNVCLSNWIEDTLCDNLLNSRLICCYDMHRWPWDFCGMLGMIGYRSQGR